MPNPHTVTVTVGANNKVDCKPDPVPVNGPNVKLKFELATDGYVFAAQDAIVVTDGGSEFPDRSKTASDGKTATLHDKNSARAYFKYTVTLQPAGGGQPIVYDPGIQNENGG